MSYEQLKQFDVVIPPSCLSNTHTPQSPPFPRSVEIIPHPYILPACYKARTDTSRPDSFFDPRSDPTAFFEIHLDTHSLDAYEPYLWIAGLRGHIRPLHRQRAIGRTITLVEDLSLHLIWRPRQIFITPLNAAYLHHESFRKFFCTRAKPHDNDSIPSRETSNDTENTRKTQLYLSALGLLQSYTKLIIYESDLQIAKDLDLLPTHVSYDMWVTFARSLSDGFPSYRAHLPPRWHFGELRLPRLNLLTRLPLPLPAENLSRSQRMRYFIRGYHMDHDSYGDFFKSNFHWLLAVFATLSVVLSALQVGVGVSQGQSAGAFLGAAWWVSMIVMVVVAGVVAALILVLLGAVPFNAFYVWGRESKWQATRKSPVV